MLAVTFSVVAYVHAPSTTERPASAPIRRRVLWRSTGILFVIVLSFVPRWSGGPVSVNDEAKVGLVGSNRLDAGGNAVNPVDLGQQRRLGVRCRRKPVIGTRQLLLGNRPNHIGRHQDHQFGLVTDVV